MLKLFQILLTQVEGKFRLMESNLKQQESKELQKELNRKTFKKQNKISEVSIFTTEHLKLLKELSDNFYTKDIKVGLYSIKKKCCISYHINDLLQLNSICYIKHKEVHFIYAILRINLYLTFDKL